MTTKKYETVLRWMTRSPNSLSIWVTGHPPALTVQRGSRPASATTISAPASSTRCRTLQLADPRTATTTPPPPTRPIQQG